MLELYKIGKTSVKSTLFKKDQFKEQITVIEIIELRDEIARSFGYSQYSLDIDDCVQKCNKVINDIFTTKNGIKEPNKSKGSITCFTKVEDDIFKVKIVNTLYHTDVNVYFTIYNFGTLLSYNSTDKILNILKKNIKYNNDDDIVDIYYMIKEKLQDYLLDINRYLVYENDLSKLSVPRICFGKNKYENGMLTVALPYTFDDITNISKSDFVDKFMTFVNTTNVTKECTPYNPNLIWEAFNIKKEER